MSKLFSVYSAHMLRFLLLIIVLIVYGSLYPFKFSGQMPTGSEIFTWSMDIFRRTTRVDIIANILLFVPYGIIARMYINQHKARLKSAIWLILIGALIAYLLQLAQFFLPARVASAGDTVLNVVGIIVGMLFSHLLMQYSHNHIPAGDNTQSSWSKVSLPLLLALIWICWRWFPFIPLVSTESIIANLKPILLAPDLDFLVILRDGIGWLLFFYLISQPPFDKQPRFRVLKIAFFIVGIEIFIVDNALTVNDLLAALGAFALYASLYVSALNRLLLWSVIIAMILTWLGPFNWHDAGRGISWMPFGILIKGPWEDAELILLKLYLISSAIYLFKKTQLDWGLSTVAGAIFVFVLVQLQRYLGAITPDISDVIAVLLVGWALFQIEKLASEERAFATHT
jgi:VanZ family protein